MEGEEIRKEEIEKLLESFRGEEGRYKTLELISFLNTFVFSHKKDDSLYQEQLFLNMDDRFANHFTPQQLL